MSWVYPRSSMVTILPVSSPFSGLVLILFVTSMDSLLTIVVYLLLSARLNKFSCTPNTSREKEVFWVSQRNEYWTSSLVLQYTKRKKKEFTSTAIGSLNRLSFADEMFSSNESDLLSLLEAPPLLSFHLRSCLRPHLPPLSLSLSLAICVLSSFPTLTCKSSCSNANFALWGSESLSALQQVREASRAL